MPLVRKILCSWISHQKTLFSCAEELLGPLTELQTKLCVSRRDTEVRV